MKKTKTQWSLHTVIVSICLIALLVPLQAFGQDDLVPIEESAMEASGPASLEQDAEDTSGGAPFGLDDAIDAEDESAPEDGTDDADGEDIDSATETASENENGAPEVESAPPCHCGLDPAISNR